MLSDDYDLIAGLDMRDGKYSLTLFYSEKASTETQVLFLYEAPDGEPRYLFTSREYFFAFCLMIQHDIVETYNESEEHFSYIADEKWTEVQNRLGMPQRSKQALRLQFRAMPTLSDERSHFRLRAGSVEIALSTNALLVLPQVAGFVQNDWRSLIALTR